MEEKSENKSIQTPFAQTYFHGKKAYLKLVDFIEVGYKANYGQIKNAKYIFLSATLDADGVINKKLVFIYTNKSSSKHGLAI